MKKLVIVLSVVLVIVSCQNEKFVKIKGKIENGKGLKVVFENEDVYFSKRLDSTVLKSGGRFSFKAKVRTADFFAIRFDSSSLRIPLLVQPGDKIIINADYNEIPRKVKIKGSEESVALNDLQVKLFETQQTLDSISILYDKGSDSEKEDLIKKYQDVLENHRKYNISFILKNMGSMTSYAALSQQYNDGYPVFNKVKDLQYFKLVTDSLTKKYSRSEHVIALKENTSKMLGDYNSRKLLSLVSSNDFHLPEIALPGVNNDTVKLSSLKGKVILLSFWATWAESSVPYNIQLKNIYEKYRNKGFEIYSVSLDNHRPSWLNEIRFDELNWINVIDTVYPNSLTMMTYNVQALPYNYLLGKDFESILAKNISPGQLDARLKELLK